MTSKREELRDCHHCLYEPIDATHKPCSECYNNEHWHCGTPRREDRATAGRGGGVDDLPKYTRGGTDDI